MADPVTLQNIYDLFKASQADLQASREDFDRRMAESKAESDRQMAKLEQLAANTSREVGHLGDRSLKKFNHIFRRCSLVILPSL
jgi:hypothetical protein